MRYLVLASDYDGTLAHDGVVEPATIAAVERFRAAGGRPILVTGRELPDLQQVFPHLALFERVVAENGGLLHDPSTGRDRVLGPARDARLVEAMRVAGVSPLSVGRTIVATVEPYERLALEVIRTLGLEAQVIFNKGAVMVLPSGVNKATGLRAALDELDLSPHNVAGVGDAENDHALFDACELSVAVANAIPALRARADLVTTGARGAGVAELIERLLDHPEDPCFAPSRHRLPLGDAKGQEIAIDPFGRHVFISDPLGLGRSTLTRAWLEQLADRRYQFCLVDPAGEHGEFSHAMRMGTTASAPPIEDVVGALRRPDQNVIVSLASLPTAERPRFCASLLPRVQELSTATGRPHWLVVDAAHELLPSGFRDAEPHTSRGWPSVALVTRDHDWVPHQVRRQIDVVVAVGEVVPQLASLLQRAGVPAVPEVLLPGTARLWHTRGGMDPMTFTVRLPAQAHQPERCT